MTQSKTSVFVLYYKKQFEEQQVRHLLVDKECWGGVGKDAEVVELLIK